MKGRCPFFMLVRGIDGEYELKGECSISPYGECYVDVGYYGNDGGYEECEYYKNFEKKQKEKK